MTIDSVMEWLPEGMNSLIFLVGLGMFDFAGYEAAGMWAWAARPVGSKAIGCA